MNIINFITSRPEISGYIAAIIILTIVTIWKKWFILNKKNLFQQKLFWISIGVPLISFIYFGLFSWWGKTPVLSAHGYARFYEISKFPLLILASSVPLASIVNNIHRTIQTEAQINSSEIKNAIDRHFSHEKNFVEKIKEMATFTMQNLVDETSKFYEDEGEDEKIKILTTHEVKISNPYFLYSKIYTESSIKIDSDYTPCNKFRDEVLSHLDIIESNLSLDEKISNNNVEHTMNRLCTITYHTAKLLDLLCVDCISIAATELITNNIKIKTFTPMEGIYGEILEAAFYLSRKVLKLSYNIEPKNYDNIYNYLYIGEVRFSSDLTKMSLHSFYSPEWSAYVSEHPILIDDGGNLAAEH